jgi:hypothetical protein
MASKRFWVAATVAVLLAGCGGGDVNLAPVNIANNPPGGGGGGGVNNPCARYTVGGVTQQGVLNGLNCVYNSQFVGENNPLTVDLTIPFIPGGVHIFLDSLFVGTNVQTGAAPAGGTGPKLTIEAGNTIAFQRADSYVLINRGSQIFANGNPSAPITFTAARDAVDGAAGPLDDSLWGGIVINGNGITNNCTAAQIAANQCHVVSEGKPSNYGGGDNDDNSGVLRYVVVKHTGFEVAPDDELNGITFNAVGRGTTVSYIQTYSTFDDGIEFFGGAVDVDHYVAVYVKDDSIDYSDGYIGTIRYALVIQNADGRGSNKCIEGDNIGDTRFANGEDPLTEPVSNPTVQNMTCIVANVDTGTHGRSQGVNIRRGPQLQLKDSITWGFYLQDTALNNDCFDPADSSTRGWMQSGVTTYSQSMIACEVFAPVGRTLANGDSALNWYLNTSTVGASYPGNVNNRYFGDRAAPPQLLVANSYYSLPNAQLRDGAGNVLPVSPEPQPDGSPGFLGAVLQNADWTANWTYGLKDPNRGIPLWFE